MGGKDQISQRKLKLGCFSAQLKYSLGISEGNDTFISAVYSHVLPNIFPVNKMILCDLRMETFCLYVQYIRGYVLGL